MQAVERAYWHNQLRLFSLKLRTVFCLIGIFRFKSGASKKACSTQIAARIGAGCTLAS